MFIWKKFSEGYYDLFLRESDTKEIATLYENKIVFPEWRNKNILKTRFTCNFGEYAHFPLQSDDLDTAKKEAVEEIIKYYKEVVEQHETVIRNSKLIIENLEQEI